MDAESSSLCNCVVNFLLEENYLLSAFELLHELLEDGRDNQAIRLKQFFSDPSRFPPDQISRFNSLKAADPQSLLEEKESLEEKLAVSDYELRLAQEDILKIKTELQKNFESKSDKTTDLSVNVSEYNGSNLQTIKKDVSFSDLGPLKENERLDINCAVKEYLLLAGYRLTAMTFYEEVNNQNLDQWQNSSACVQDALRHYYYQYLSSGTEAAEEKIAMLRENESLLKESDRLKKEKQSLLKTKEMYDTQATTLTKSLETLQKDIKDREILVQDLRKTLERQRIELNDCRAEITSLKMHIEGAQLGKFLLADTSHLQTLSLKSRGEDKEFIHDEIEKSQTKKITNPEFIKSVEQEERNDGGPHEVKELPINDHALSQADQLKHLVSENTSVTGVHASNDTNSSDQVLEELQSSSGENGFVENSGNSLKSNEKPSSETERLIGKPDYTVKESNAEKMGLETIQILSNSLPKIVPYVLINHREELLPLIMCAIERHPVSDTRDSLTHSLFNLIKRPDEQQRRIIMNACVALAKNVGELRTETELLPQCWEQINHMYEERRLLVAQSCGELAVFVRPEIRDSLILSIVQQLVEDPATVVREAAAHNLALLLPLFPNTDKYFKVEEIMFQLVCDSSGIVVETTIKELVPALVHWGGELDHILRVLLSHILGCVQHCPPLSGVEGSVESHLHVLGERERWNVDVLLRLLSELLLSVHQKAIVTCPFSSAFDTVGISITSALLDMYARGNVEWPAFEWLHAECFPSLIQLSSLLPQKEDNIRNRITKFLLAVADQFGESYLNHVMLPVFLVAIGDNADLKLFPSPIQSKLRGLKPKTAVAQRLSTMCVLPLLLAGILGNPSKRDHLTEYLRNLLIQSSGGDGQPEKHDIIHAVRFICTFDEHHDMILKILWEMVVSTDVNLKMNAANLLKVLIPYIDSKVASAHVLPALVTLGSDQNLNVKYASIDAFGAVAQHFKTDTIVDKIRIQMDAFLEDGSHEATIAVVRALVVSVPHTTDTLRDYLLSKIFQLTSMPSPTSEVKRRRERSNVFCESIRALDATDIPSSSVRDFFLPAIQNILKDSDALDPAHKEALEIIMKERSGGTFDALNKVMGVHLGLPSSVTSFFGESGLLSKKESGDTGSPIPNPVEIPKPAPQPPVEDTRFMRIMRGGFSDMLRGKGKSSEDMQQTQ